MARKEKTELEIAREHYKMWLEAEEEISLNQSYAKMCIRDSSKTAATILATTSKNIDGILLEAEKFKLFIRFILRKLTPLECERLQELSLIHI